MNARHALRILATVGLLALVPGCGADEDAANPEAWAGLYSAEPPHWARLWLERGGTHDESELVELFGPKRAPTRTTAFVQLRADGTLTTVRAHPGIPPQTEPFFERYEGRWRIDAGKLIVILPSGEEMTLEGTRQAIFIDSAGERLRLERVPDVPR